MQSAMTVTVDGTFNASELSVAGGTAELTNTYTYDHLNQLTRVTQSGDVSGNAGMAAKQVDLEYDGAGQLTSVTDPERNTTRCEYHRFRRAVTYCQSRKSRRLRCR